MNKKQQQRLLIVGIAAFAAGLATAELLKQKGIRTKLSKIAEEGYETAHDILFPDKLIPEKKLHFGPVLPDL